MGVDLRTFGARNSDTACRVDMNLHRVNGLIRFNRRYGDKFVFAGKGIGRNQADGNRCSQDTNACLKEHIPAPKKEGEEDRLKRDDGSEYSHGRCSVFRAPCRAQ